MRQLVLAYAREFNWDLLPIWVSFAFSTSWLALVTTLQLSEAGVTPEQAEPLITIFEWLPLFFVVIPFFRAALGLLLARAIPERWQL